MGNYEIAVDARMIHASGIGTYLQNILPGICKTYKSVLLGRKEFLKDYQADIIEYDVPIYSIKETFTMPFIIPKCKVFWSPHFNVPVSAIKADNMITTIHDVFHLAFYNSLSRKQKIYAKIFYNLAVKRSNKVITVSEFSKSEILKYIPVEPSKIKVIYNGVIHDEFSKSYPEDQAIKIKEKYDLPQNYILFVGNVKPHKNLMSLVYALEGIFKKDSSLYLVVVGKQEGFITGDHELAKVIEASPLLKQHIKFTGFAAKSELPFLYQRARLFVFPSLYEGFGLPPLEAMAANTLTAVTNQASLPEICKDGSLYFDSYSKEAIMHTLEEALNLSPEEEEKVKQIASTIVQDFTWEQSKYEHISLFNEYIH